MLESVSGSAGGVGATFLNSEGGLGGQGGLGGAAGATALAQQVLHVSTTVGTLLQSVAGSGVGGVESEESARYRVLVRKLSTLAWQVVGKLVEVGVMYHNNRHNYTD
jgi:hypothetical protein